MGIGMRFTALAAAALVVAGTGCPKRGGPGEQTPPFVHGGAAGDLGEPPGPDADTFGLPWLELVYPRFRDAWATFVNDCRLRLPVDHPLNDPKLAVVVAVDVDASGAVRRLAVNRSSGNRDFDQVAVDIAREAAPYPPPPAELISDDDRVHLRWGFHRDQRLAGPATASIDRIEWPLQRAVPKLLARGDLAAAARRIDGALREGNGEPEAAVVELARALAAAAIRQAIASTDGAVRRAGIAAAGRARLKVAAPEIRLVAGSSTDPALQREAVRALGAIGDADAAPLLREMIDSRAGAESSATAAAAVEALAALGHGPEVRQAIASRLAGGDVDRRAAALVLAAQVPVPEGLTTLAALAGSQATPRQQRVAACAAVGLAGTAAADRPLALRALRKGLDAGDAAVRAACAHSLAALAAAGARSAPAYWRAVELLRDRDERVRAGAVLAAIRLDPARAGAELSIMTREKSPLVTAAYAEGLAVLPEPPAVDRLIALTRHADVEIRRRAAASLAARAEKRAQAALAALAGDADAGVQLQALAAIDGPEAVAPLVDASDGEVRAAAFARLVALRGQPATAAMLCARLSPDELDAAEAARLAGAWLAPRPGP